MIARPRFSRIHDLRHTAACLWLARGVDVSTVQNWMGHASIATTNLYLHHLGTGADLAGLERLNRAPGATGGPAGRAGELQRRIPRMIRAFAQVTRGISLVELRGFEPLTFSLRTRRATNCATAPNEGKR